MLNKLAVMKPSTTDEKPDFSKGLMPNPLLLSHEDPQAYEALRLRYVEDFRPRDFSDFEALNSAVWCHWLMNRMISWKTRAMSDETMFHMLPYLERWEQRYRRMHITAMKTLRKVRSRDCGTDQRKAA